MHHRTDTPRSLAVSLFYCFIAASIAELASAIPSSTGVYHFATVAAGPKYGKVTGYFAGWWNYFAWIFGAASMSSIMGVSSWQPIAVKKTILIQSLGNMVVAMWALFHQDYVFQVSFVGRMRTGAPATNFVHSVGTYSSFIS